MNHGYGLKAFGLALLSALTLMTFMAHETQASFLVENLTGEWSAQVTGEAENILESYLLFLKLNLKLGCHEAESEGYIGSSGYGHVRVFLADCLLTDKEGLPGDCQFLEPLESRLLASVILHTDGKPYILLQALDLGFLAITDHGLICPFPEGALVLGSAVASISNPDDDDTTKLISTKGMAALFPSHKLTYGVHQVHLVADANVHLGGNHLGVPWGAS